MRVKYSKLYTKYQVVTKDGRILEEFMSKKIAQKFARDYEQEERNKGITEARMAYRAKQLCDQHDKHELALIIANMERTAEEKVSNPLLGVLG